MTPSGISSSLPQAVRDGTEPVMVYILFTDVVGGSRFANEDQQRTNTRLTELVMGLPDFHSAHAAGELISIDTGDGVSLVFFNRVEAPLRCAIGIAQALHKDPFCKLRMGIHSGLVYLRTDFNGRTNVTGEGINTSQRVMSCGGDGHILLSDAIAGRLKGLAAWRDKLHLLGDYRAKQDVVRVWNFVDGDVGSSAPLPAKLASESSRRMMLGGAAVALLAAAGAAWWKFGGPMHSLRYGLLLKNADGSARPISEDQLPPSTAQLKFQFEDFENGFLYLVAESHSAPGAAAEWFWMFPEPGYNDGSAAVQANTKFSVPTPPDRYIEFDPGPGQEFVHVLWSEQPLAEVEAVKKALFTRMSGDQLSAEEAARLTGAISELAEAAGKRDGASTVASGRGAALAVRFILGHM